MNRPFFPYRGNIRAEGSALVLVLAFLALPYLLDVACLADLTPSHFAQENLAENEDIQVLDDKEFSFNSDNQDNAVVTEISPPTGRYTCAQDSIPAGAVFPPQYLIFASLISRPPPAFQLV